MYFSHPLKYSSATRSVIKTDSPCRADKALIAVKMRLSIYHPVSMHKHLICVLDRTFDTRKKPGLGRTNSYKLLTRIDVACRPLGGQAPSLPSFVDTTLSIQQHGRLMFTFSVAWVGEFRRDVRPFIVRTQYSETGPVTLRANRARGTDRARCSTEWRPPMHR